MKELVLKSKIIAVCSGSHGKIQEEEKMIQCTWCKRIYNFDTKEWKLDGAYTYGSFQTCPDCQKEGGQYGKHIQNSKSGA